MKYLLMVAALFVAAPANADVVSATAGGFAIRHQSVVPAAPDAAFAAFVDVQKWWNPAHSYSGDPARLSLSPTAGGCFCERLSGGGIEHMRVSYVDRPGRLVLTGALGPLLFEAVAAVMDVKFEPAAKGTRVTLEFKAAGFASGNAERLAVPVDRVLGEQLGRFAATLAR